MHSIHRLTPPLALAALLSGMLAAGCGASSPNTTGATSTAAGDIQSGVAFSRCIRSHGVANFNDPKVKGQTVRLGSPAVLQSPAFQSAMHSCQRLLPKGPPSSEPPSPRAQIRMLEVSDCMRKHGISGFPDPSTSPSSNSAANGEIMGSGGYYLVIPASIDMNSPAFQRAAAACNFGPGR